MWLFRKKKETRHNASELPRSREELLLGDTSRTWSLNDFSLLPELESLAVDIEDSLKKIFEKGELDGGNGNFFDATIDATAARALSDLNGQYALRPEGINKMVSWRERDISELRFMENKHQKNISDASDELKKCTSKLEKIQKIKGE